MTKRRYRKLARAYFTRLNEWAKANGSETMNMGDVYRIIRNLGNPCPYTREEWWEAISKGDAFGVGKTHK